MRVTIWTIIFSIKLVTIPKLSAKVQMKNPIPIYMMVSDKSFLIIVINLFYFEYCTKDWCNKFWTFDKNDLHKKQLPYLLQHKTPRMITTTASILVTHTVGQQHATTHPAPNAIQRNSFLIHFLIVNTPICCIYYIIFKNELIVTLYQKQNSRFNINCTLIINDIIADSKLIALANIHFIQIIKGLIIISTRNSDT